MVLGQHISQRLQSVAWHHIIIYSGNVFSSDTFPVSEALMTYTRTKSPETVLLKTMKAIREMEKTPELIVMNDYLLIIKHSTKVI